MRTITVLIAIIHLIGYMLLPPGTDGWLAGPETAGAAAGGPKLLGTSPANQATGVSVDTNLILIFDEEVTRGTGSAAVTIRRVDNNSVVETFETATSSRVSISSNVVTIDPTQNLDPNTGYYVIIDAGAFRNTRGENYAGLNSATAWRFVTGAKDQTPPALLQKPASVQVGQPIVLTFSEPVYAASGVITITNILDAADSRTIAVTSGEVSGSGTATISILPSIPLKAGQTYKITVPNTAFEDAAGNRLSGTNEWNVTVSGSAVTITGLSPADDATGVSADTNQLVMTFNTAVQKDTSGNKKITVKNLISNADVYKIDVSSSAVSVNQKTVTIQLPGKLSANTSYYVLVDPGAFFDKANPKVLFPGIQDATTWNFTTMPGNDVTKPTIVELVPADDSVNAGLSQSLKIKFSEPVYPGSGEIVIRYSQTDLIFETIPVTSSNVTGFGTDTISITVTNRFVMNQSYYVQIGKQAFRDAAGNYFDGISDKTTWNFSVSSDTTPPTIAAMKPAAGTNSVDPNETFELTFSEAIRINTQVLASKPVVFRGSKSGTGTVQANISVDPADGRKLILKPASALQTGASYYVEIPAGVIEDLVGNPFGGILNEHIWPFSTKGTDRTPPVIQSAAMSGTNRIVLTYNELLDESSVPPTGSFYVTANDIRVNVTEVTVTGYSVVLTLQSGIVYGQTVKLYYTKSSPAIRDLSGNEAANLTNYTVKNEAGSTQTAPISGSVSGNILTLNFNSSLQPVHEEAYRQFSVYAGGAYIAPSRIASSGSTITLTLSSSVTTEGPVSVYYSSGAYPLRDVAGNTVASFSNFPVRNTLDKTPPVLQSIYGSGNTIMLMYNETLDSGSVPKTNQFIVMESGVSRAISSVSVSGTVVTLTLSSTPTNYKNVTVSYLGSSPALRDLNGNNAPRFSNQPVTNGLVIVNLQSATVSGNVVQLYFDSTLKTTNLPAASQFTVKENGVVRTVASVSVSGSVVSLTLASPISSGSTVTVSYTPSSTGMLQSTTGLTVPAFSDYVVTHGSGNTGGPGGTDLGGNFETATGGGVNIKEQGATVSTRTSSGGRTANRYFLSANTVSEAYSLSRSRFNVYRVTFTVPSSQAAAMVELPADAMLNIKKQSNQATFSVMYGDVAYELPLGALDEKEIADLIRQYGQGNLLFEIDKGSVNQAGRLRTAIMQQQLEMISDTYVFNLSFVSGSYSKPLTQFKEYQTMKLLLSRKLSEREHVVVRLDSETGKLAHVPTIISNQGNMAVVTFKNHANTAYALVRNTVSFTDTTNHWAHSAIQFMANRMIAAGRTGTKFMPKQPITRAEFAVFIVRGLGLEGSRYDARNFRDISPNSELASYIGAAYKAGIISGVSSTRFDPDSPITREQMASMMVRAARAMGVEILTTRSQSEYLKPYKDAGTLSSWARSDMVKAIEAQIIKGMTKDSLGPKRNATRAEAIVMIERLLRYLNLM
ncbi:MAG: hypothetical protein A9Z00_11970 [Thermobacillus sp. ZCTH02-B1]|uniref:Ig-like domain-containing protein n=1 Tax=Thermobacillus sp. ZCTH02-B1 TaxID=1858795 RepID=UPI000B55A9D2|nr:Ig-like domain-containing protein [Thermobacillus sp. ZCTH02-B1]OUM94960.1 MAG: hypothetical protein A9Z00_11970 [Thermobacillus sp. ZCTH02-B1]